MHKNILDMSTLHQQAKKINLLNAKFQNFNPLFEICYCSIIFIKFVSKIDSKNLNKFKKV